MHTQQQLLILFFGTHCELKVFTCRFRGKIFEEPVNLYTPYKLCKYYRPAASLLRSHALSKNKLKRTIGRLGRYACWSMNPSIGWDVRPLDQQLVARL